jgi:hypothetical protein
MDKDIEPIRKKLINFKGELEKEFKPLNIHHIELITSSGYKVSLIDDNKPLARRLSLEEQSNSYGEPMSHSEALKEFEQQLQSIKINYNRLKDRLVQKHRYEETAKLVALGKAYRLEG